MSNNDLPPPAWHSLETADVLSAVASSQEGLQNTEAERRLHQHGPNRLRPAKKKSPLARFLIQFHNVLIYVLLASSLITALLGHWLDSGVILGVVMINAIIGFIQEGKAEKALDAIRDMSIESWLRVVIVASSVLFLVEIEKMLLRKYYRPRRRA